MTSDNSKYQVAIEGYKLLFLMHQTSDAIFKSRELELKKFNISPEQSLALVCIYSLKNKATPAEISRWVFREPNSVAVLLKRMQKLGLIKRASDPQRKNIIRLSLTPKGLEAYKHSVEFQTFFTVVKTLTPAKRQRLYSMLLIMREEAFKLLNLSVVSYSSIINEAKFEPDADYDIAEKNKSIKPRRTKI